MRPTMTRRLSRVLSLCSAALFAVLVAESCSGGDGGSAAPAGPPAPAAVATVTLSQASAQLESGEALQLSATPRSAKGDVLSGRTTTWASSNSASATVNANGLVSALAAGTAAITATIEGQVATATVVVVPAAVATVSVALAPSTLEVGQSVNATATLRDARNAALAGRTVAWSSSNAAIATVSNLGVVLPLAPGTTSITATSEGKVGTAALTVLQAAVASATVSLAAAVINAGTTTTATATLRDARNAVLAGRVVTWTSSDLALATVASSGLVTGIAPGPVTITVTSEGKSASIALVVWSTAALFTIKDSIVVVQYPTIWDVHPRFDPVNFPNPRVQPGGFNRVGGHWAFNWTTSACPCPVGIMTSGASDVKFNAFDLYAMGLMGYQETKTYSYTVYETNSFGTVDRFKPHDVNVDTLINALVRAGPFYLNGNGRRIPDMDPANQSFNILLVLVAGRDQIPSATLLSRLQQISRDFPPDWATATWGRSQMNPMVIRR